MLLTLEISNPFQPKPRFKITKISGKKAYTFTWLWFQIAYLPITMYRFVEKCRKLEVGWED